MKNNNRNIALICNLTLLGYLFSFQFHLNDYILALLINLLNFVVPGIAWIGCLKNKIKDAVCLLFFIFLFSITSCFAAHVLMLIVRMSIGPLQFVGILACIVNLGIFLTRPAEVFSLFKMEKREWSLLAVCILCIYSCIYIGMKTVPEKLDLDGEHQGTAYGFIYELKPYLTSDIIESPYYFAHPPLTNLFNAYSTLLSGQLDEYKYFYDTAKMAENVLNLSVGEQTLVYIKEEPRTVGRFNQEYYMMKQMIGNDMLDSSYTKQRLIEYIAQNDQNRFFSNPRVFPARMSNIFASVLVFLVLYYLIVYLTQSRLLGFLGGLVYIFTPGIYIRSCFSEHVAYTNCLLVLLTYQWVNSKALDWSGRFWKYCQYLPGIVGGLVNQKIVILVIPIFIMALYQAFRQRADGRFIKNVMKHSVIPIGFGIGTLLFWIYGLAIDHNAFVLSHLKVHLFDRLAHHNTMFAEDYPNKLRLWYEFSREFPLFYVALLAMVICLIRYTHSTTLMLTAWIICGSVLFTLVDWKQTNHLTQLVIPFLLCLMIYIENQKTGYKRMLKIIVGLGLIYCVAFDLQLLKNFSYYMPTSNW